MTPPLIRALNLQKKVGTERIVDAFKEEEFKPVADNAAVRSAAFDLYALQRNWQGGLSSGAQVRSESTERYESATSQLRKLAIDNGLSEESAQNLVGIVVGAAIDQLGEDRHKEELSRR